MKGKSINLVYNKMSRHTIIQSANDKAICELLANGVDSNLPEAANKTGMRIQSGS
jgi:hypothetical protein